MEGALQGGSKSGAFAEEKSHALTLFADEGKERSDAKGAELRPKNSPRLHQKKHLRKQVLFLSNPKDWYVITTQSCMESP